MYWFAIFGCLLISLMVWWYYLFFKYSSYFAKYKGPTPLPIIGNLHQLGPITEFLSKVGKIHRKYGPVVKLWAGYKPKLMISDYKVAEQLLGSTVIIDKSYVYTFLHSWLGTGLLTSSGAKWKKHRKLLTPAFHFKILEQFIHIFHTQSDILVEKLRGEANKGPFDVYPFINLCALDVICEATMGTKINAQHDTDSSYVVSVKEICRILISRTFTPLKMADCLYMFSRDFWKEKKALAVLHGYSNSVIKSRRQQLSILNDKNHDQEENGFGIKKRLAFLDLLLQASVDGTPIPPDDIREEVDTFMFEGHDTTTAGLVFTLYLLSIHPNAQDQVVDELRTIFSDNSTEAPTYQNLQDMKYLELVIKESLRLYPPVPLFDRQIAEDTEFDGNILPKGTTLSLLAYYLHRQEEVYENPEEFDPERFTVENSSKRSPYAYVPFSAGPRNCIGQRFAMLEMKSIISKILRVYEILPAVGYKPQLNPEVVLKSTNGIMIRLKER